MRQLNPVIHLRKLYDWTMKWSDHPKVEPFLGVFSSVEGIFFPIPIDPFLLAASAAQPKKSLRFAAIATAGSIVGGTVGYLLGMYFWEQLSELFFTYMFSPENFDLVGTKLQEDAFLAVFLASLTPIPYKMSAVVGGVFQISLLTFLGASIVGRSLRFFSIGILFYYWGAPVRDYIDENFNRITYTVGALCVAGFLIYKLL